MKAPRRARTLVVALALLGALSIAPRAARAQTYQRTTAIVAGSVFGAVDLFFIGYDLAMSERGKRPSQTLVWIELPAMTLQIATGISMVATALQPDSRLATIGVERELYLPIGAVLATVAAPLLAHAVRYSLDRGGSGMHAIHLVPTRVGDARASGPGLVLAGRF